MNILNKFYQEFNIEKFCYNPRGNCLNCKKSACVHWSYPEITTSILLKLEELVFKYCDYGLCIDNDMYCYFDTTDAGRPEFNHKNRKLSLINLCTFLKRDIYEYVRFIIGGKF